MGELYGIIQRHLDRYGVREAALARRMDTSSQTINSWKTRGVKQLPTRKLLEALARETGTPYAVVLQAALVDTGYAATLTPGTGGEAPRPSDPAPELDLSEVHRPRPEDNSGVASRPAHAPSRSRVAGGKGTRPPHT
jgi:hypothetical protein